MSGIKFVKNSDSPRIFEIKFGKLPNIKKKDCSFSSRG